MAESEVGSPSSMTVELSQQSPLAPSPPPPLRRLKKIPSGVLEGSTAMGTATPGSPMSPGMSQGTTLVLGGLDQDIMSPSPSRPPVVEHRPAAAKAKAKGKAGKPKAKSSPEPRKSSHEEETISQNYPSHEETTSSQRYPSHEEGSQGYPNHEASIQSREEHEASQYSLLLYQTQDCYEE